LDTPEVIKLPMPVGLGGQQSMTYVYEYNSSCPAQLNRLDRKTTEELVHVLIDTLATNFSLVADPEIILGKVAAKGTGIKHNLSIAVIGASVMSQLVPHLRALGLPVHDITKPGWVPSAAGLAEVSARLQEVPREGTIFVLDLLSNSTYRWLQYDGSTALPMKQENRFHLPGEVVVADLATITKTLGASASILQDLGPGPKVFIPPLPRYINTPCCANPSHCSNTKSPAFAEITLGDLTQVRANLLKVLTDLQVKNFKILDGIGGISVYGIGNRPGNKEIVNQVKAVMAPDGVHLKEAGLHNLAAAISETVKKNTMDGAACFTIPGRATSYFWRGFDSPVGSQLRHRTGRPPGPPGGHPKSKKRLHPYKR